MAQSYVPRILLCGETSSFQAAAADMQVDIVGKISFTGSPERGENYIFPNPADVYAFVPKDLRIFLDGAEISVDALKKILDGTADYIVFDHSGEFIGRSNDLHASGIVEQLITRETLFRQARRQFYSFANFVTLADILRGNKISRLLDVDAALADTDLFMFPEHFPTVDAVADRHEPIHENFYGRIYATLAECRYKFFDALLLIERTPENFIDTLTATDDLSDVIVTFARKNTALEKFLSGYAAAFAEISATPAVNGNWYVIRKRTPKNFCVYVVTHKDAKLDALPDGYKIIHAGHAQSTQTFGDVTDDTGDNISRLNLYLNEMTALYWMWRNTSQAIVGLNHYRRFFTTSRDTNFAAEKILSQSEATELLRDWDIIVAENVHSLMSASCWQMMISGWELERFVDEIFRRHIALKQPDYLDAFDHVSNAFTGFQYEIFITRRKIFDDYCEWIFSFLLDATEEVLARTNLRQIDNPRKYRVVSFFAERLLTVWLRKNPVRIKKLPVMFRAGV